MWAAPAGRIEGRMASSNGRVHTRGGSAAPITKMTGAGVATAVLPAAAAKAASPLLQLRLSGRALPVAADLSVVVRVEPDDRNRDLVVMVDSGDYMRSSSEQLDGADAARAHQFWFKHLPEGQYALVAQLDGT